MDNVIIVSFGIAGIIINAILLVLSIVLKVKDIDENFVFGYRTGFSLSSEEAWEWSNKTFATICIIGTPILLIGHIVVFALSMLLGLPTLYITLTMFSSLIFIICVIPFIEIIGRKKIGYKK